MPIWVCSSMENDREHTEHMKMRTEYELQLKQLKEKMEKAEAFALRCPIFSEKILDEIITGEETWKKYANTYKSVRTYDGVIRGHYSSSTTRNILNYKGEYDIYCWRIYINTLGEYDSNNDYGLDEICKNTPLYFYDNLNSTFYCTDEQIEKLLEALDKWKINAVAQCIRDSIDQEIKDAEEILKKTIERLDGLKSLKRDTDI